MKIEINKNELQKALNIASRCYVKKPTIPVLACVKLEFRENECVIMATDLDQTVSVRIPAEGGNATICVIGQTLRGVVANMSDETVTLDVGEDLKILRPNGDIKLRGTNPEQYPLMDSLSDARHSFGFDAGEFLEVCKLALLGTAEDKVLQGWTNVMELSVERNLIEGKFRAITSDRTRLAIVDGLCDTEEKDPFKVQLPVYALRTLLAALPQIKAEKIAVTDNQKLIRVDAGAVTYTFRKMDAQFPDLTAYLEKIQFDKTLSLNAEELTSSLELVSQISEGVNHRIDFALNGNLTLSALSGDVGEIEEVIETEIDFEPFTAGYNSTFILPVLRQLSGEIELRFAKDANGYHPLRIRSEKNNLSASFDVQSLTD